MAQMEEAKLRAKEDANDKYGGLNRPIYIAIATIIVLGSGLIGQAVRESDSVSLIVFLIITTIILLIGIPTDAEHRRKRKAYQDYREIYHGDASRDQKARAELIAEFSIAEIDTLKHRRVRFWLPLIVGGGAFLGGAAAGFLITLGLDHFIFDFGRSDRKVAFITAIILCGTPVAIHYWLKWRNNCMVDVNGGDLRVNSLRKQLMEIDDKPIVEAPKTDREVELQRIEQEELKREREAEAAEQAKKIAFNQRLTKWRDLRQSLVDKFAVIDNANFTLAEKSKEVYVLDTPYLQKLWNQSAASFKEVASGLIEKSKQESKDISFTKAIDELPHLKTLPDHEIFCRYDGDSHGGHTDFFSLQDGSKTDGFLQFIRADRSIEGLFEAFYLVFELPRIGAFWHDFYGIDYTYIASEAQVLTELLHRHFFDKYDDENASAILKMPSGFMICAEDDSLRASLMADEANTGVVELSVTISKDGKITSNIDVFYQAKRVVFYS